MCKMTIDVFNEFLTADLYIMRMCFAANEEKHLKPKKKRMKKIILCGKFYVNCTVHYTTEIKADEHSYGKISMLTDKKLIVFCFF